MHGVEGAGPLRRNPDGRFERSSPPRGEPPPMGSRFDRADEFRGGRGGGRGGFFRGGPPDDFRREPWNDRGRGGPLERGGPVERDDYDRGRFRDMPGVGMGRGGPGARDKGLSRSDFAAERARVCTLCTCCALASCRFAPDRPLPTPMYLYPCVWDLRSPPTGLLQELIYWFLGTLQCHTEQ